MSIVHIQIVKYKKWMGGGWVSWIRRHLVIVAPCDPSSTLLVSIVAPTSGNYHYTHSYTSSYHAKATNRSTKGDKKWWYFHRSLPHNYTLQHLHRLRHRRLINNRLQQSPVRKVLNRRPELLQVQYSTHYLPNQTKSKNGSSYWDEEGKKKERETSTNSK